MNRLKAIADESRASQDKFELWQLLEILDRKAPKSILEIGVHTGQMLATLGSAFPKAGLVGVDNDYKLTYEMFHGIKGDSHEQAVFDQVAEACGSVDFLFIDGDHAYQGVKQDYEMYRKLVVPGGIIAFHDIMRPSGLFDGVEVREFWDEIRGGCLTIELWGGAVRTDKPHQSDSPGTGVIFT
jgi:predicted O-methyltransferase YrrM